MAQALAEVQVQARQAKLAAIQAAVLAGQAVSTVQRPADQFRKARGKGE